MFARFPASFQQADGTSCLVNQHVLTRVVWCVSMYFIFVKAQSAKEGPTTCDMWILFTLSNDRIDLSSLIPVNRVAYIGAREYWLTAVDVGVPMKRTGATFR